MSKVNGTDAKTIAFHFLDHTTDGRYTPHVIAKTVRQAKTLLASGYTKEEICAVIDRVVKSGVNMYSMGYINVVIGDMVKEIQKEALAIRAQEERALLEKESLKSQGEVNVDVESTERNRRKAERISLQSRERTKHYFDLFEG